MDNPCLDCRFLHKCEIYIPTQGHIKEKNNLPFWLLGDKCSKAEFFEIWE